MKAALDRNQLLAMAGGGTVVLASGVLAWLGLTVLGEKQAEALALADRLMNPSLAAVLAEPQGAERARRDTAEIQKLAKDMREQDKAAAEWMEATRVLAGDGAEWAKDPGKWKDRLIAIQSQIQKEAKGQKLELEPDFYLGLEDFRQKSPTAEEVPGLALHLSVAERLVQRLLEARRVVEQYPTACRLLSISGPGSVVKKEGQEAGPSVPLSGPPPKAGLPALQAERKTFRVELRSSPEVLYQYVRLLTTDPALLIVTNLSVTNEKQNFPLRSEIAKKFSETSSPTGGEAAQKKKEAKKLLEILAGEEAVQASLEIDFVAWKRLDDKKAGAAPAATP